ncbi:ATP-binding protein [Azohydromonas caseinilytica]|uniref:ATP-binding protein n=1 Tax=Azohydromonas caseinilytica TaxID=2728836 RepID=A0A848FA35_9BURK|nr:ATP-binding protein [Azohydromonas caseinilytica]NML16404.1 ATP-binding protein [Azohydromonas caseinilytica]
MGTDPLPQDPAGVEPPEADARVIYRADIAARLEEVSRVCAEVAALAAQRGDETLAAQIDLGLSEALSNIVRHGYEAHARDARVQLLWTEQPDRWCLRLFDRGRPIPEAALQPSAHDPFDFDPLALDSLPEGGMGLALLRASFDRVDYRIGPRGNLLVLTKLLQPQARPDLEH